MLLASPGAALAQDAPAERTSASHPYAGPVAEASRRFGIPKRWIWAVLRAESNGDVSAVSSVGAIGLMQIMPGTWAGLRARYGLGSDPHDVRDNIMAGAAYLREMFDRYGNATAMLAAYNAGPGRYDDYLSRRRSLPTETLAYLAKLASITGGSSDIQPVAAPSPDPFAWRVAGLFPVRGDVASTAAATSPEAPPAASPTLAAAAATSRPASLFVPVSGRSPQ